MSKEMPPIYVMRRGDTLVPEMGIDADWIRSQPSNVRIKVKLHTGRSPKKLRLYWALLGRLVAATECAPNKEVLHEVIKLELGYTNKARLGNGQTVLTPASVAFDKMTDATFNEFFDNAARWIAETYGVTTEDLMAA